MQVVVLAPDALFEELTVEGIAEGAGVIRVSTFDALVERRDADGYIDLQFTPDAARMEALRALPAPVLVGSVVHPLGREGRGLVRIGHWPTFLQSAQVEAAGEAELRAGAQQVLAVFGKEAAWVPDVPGLFTPRIVAAIIGEALLAEAEGVSSRADIDTAMKLGTNYPYGPFEWADRIGQAEVEALLKAMGR